MMPGQQTSPPKFSLHNELLLNKTATVNLKANATRAVPSSNAPLISKQGVVLVELSMQDVNGKVISHNVYWLAADDAQFRKMNGMDKAKLRLSATPFHHETGEGVVTVQMTNEGNVASLATKATLIGDKGERLLLAYHSDNYVSIMPGVTETIVVRVPIVSAQKMGVGIRGWNVEESTIDVH